MNSGGPIHELGLTAHKVPPRPMAPKPTTLIIRYRFVHKSGTEVLMEERYPLDGWKPNAEQVSDAFARNISVGRNHKNHGPLAYATREVEVV